VKPLRTVELQSGHTPPSREQALSDERWLDAPAEGLGGFFARMTTGGLQGILAAYREADGARSNPDTKTKSVSADEAAWLAERFGREGTLKENERVLLRFSRDEAPSVAGALNSLIDESGVTCHEVGGAASRRPDPVGGSCRVEEGGETPPLPFRLTGCPCR